MQRLSGLAVKRGAGFRCHWVSHLLQAAHDRVGSGAEVDLQRLPSHIEYRITALAGNEQRDTVKYRIESG